LQFEDIFYCFQDESLAVKKQLVTSLREFTGDERNPSAQRADAALYLSFSHYNGFGIKQDLREGYRCLVEAARLGNTKAQAWVSSFSRAVDIADVDLVPDRLTMVDWLYEATRIGLFDPIEELKAFDPVKCNRAMDDLRLGFCFGEDLSDATIHSEGELFERCQGLNAEELNALVLNSGGYSPLHVAAALGYQRAVERLIVEGVDIHLQGDQGETALFCACRAGFASIALRLLQSGAKPTTTNSGESPLHWLISFEGEDVRTMARTLIASGAYLEAENDGTPLSWALSKRHTEALEVLLELGADPFNDGGNESAIITAVSSHASEFLSLLLKSRHVNREKLCQGDSDGNTLLFHAIYCHDFFHRLRRYGTKVWYAARQTVQLLLDNGCNPASIDKKGFSMLHLAAGYCDRQFLGVLLDNFDFKKYVSTPCGDPPYTPTYQAISSGRIEVVKLLISLGADTSYVFEGRTLLHILASISDEEYAMKCLGLLNLNDRQDINLLAVEQELPQGVTAFELALISGHLKVADMLIHSGACPSGPQGRQPHYLSLLIAEQSWTSPEALRFYLKHADSPFIVGEGNMSVLHFAASRLHMLADEETPAAKLDILLARFHKSEELNATNVQKVGSDVWGQAPLHLAARMGSYFAVKRLLEYGADPNIRDNRGREPLDDAKAVFEYTKERILPHEMPQVMSNLRDTIELLEAVMKGRRWPVVRRRQDEAIGEVTRARFSALGFKTE
jgi:ankyrin repeat protein